MSIDRTNCFGSSTSAAVLQAPSGNEEMIGGVKVNGRYANPPHPVSDYRRAQNDHGYPEAFEKNKILSLHEYEAKFGTIRQFRYRYKTFFFVWDELCAQRPLQTLLGKYHTYAHPVSIDEYYNQFAQFPEVDLVADMGFGACEAVIPGMWPNSGRYPCALQSCNGKSADTRAKETGGSTFPFRRHEGYPCEMVIQGKTVHVSCKECMEIREKIIGF